MGTILDQETKLIQKIAANPFQDANDSDQMARDRDFKNLVTATDKFIDYDDARIRLEKIAREAFYFESDASGWEARVRPADTARRQAHNDCIDALASINNLATAYGMEPFCEFDRTNPTSRYVVENFVMGYISELRAELGSTALRISAPDKHRQEMAQIDAAIQQADKAEIDRQRLSATTIIDNSIAEDPEWAEAKMARNSNWYQQQIAKIVQPIAETRAESRAHIAKELIPFDIPNDTTGGDDYELD